MQEKLTAKDQEPEMPLPTNATSQSRKQWGSPLGRSESQRPPTPTKPRGHTGEDQHVALTETQTPVLPHGLFFGGKAEQDGSPPQPDGNYYT